MIEKTLLDYLTANLSYPVYMEVPDALDMPQRFYIIEKTGSNESNYIENSTFAIQSYAESLYQAAVMNNSLKTAMRSLIELDEISRCKLSTDYSYPNVSAKKYRYQAIYNITHY